MTVNGLMSRCNLTGKAHKFFELPPSQAQGFSQCADGVPVGPGPLAALQIPDRPDAYARPLTELFLTQAGRLPVAPQQPPELGPPVCFPSAHAASSSAGLTDTQPG